MSRFNKMLSAVIAGTMFILCSAGILFYAPLAQTTTNAPFSKPIMTQEGLIIVDVIEFATIPDYDERPARMMLMTGEPGGSRSFVNDMYGRLYSISQNGNDVTLYLDLNSDDWNVDVQYSGSERGFQSFAFHPEFRLEGTPGYGRFYTFSDVKNAPRPPDFRPGGGLNTHQTVLHEWIANDTDSPVYVGDEPRELMRFVQPFRNNNGGMIAFNPYAEPDDQDFGLLYMGVADGGSNGDPLELAQDLRSPYGKILRIDPLGDNSFNGRYGIPGENPWAGLETSRNLEEIYAYGLRNPQRFGWDRKNGNLFVADIGEDVVEKVSLVPKGGNLGWNLWEGSFRFVDIGEVELSNPRSNDKIVYPLAEFGRFDPLMLHRIAVTGIHVYRSGPLTQLKNTVLFGDLVTGELLYFDADNLPDGGMEEIRWIVLRDEEGEIKTLHDLIREKNIEQGRKPAPRTDMRFGTGSGNQFFLLNKQDGTIRKLISTE